MANKFADTSTVSLEQLLNDQDRLMVPKFQRNYDWNEEKVMQLLSDMTDNFRLVKNEAINKPEAQYLLGSIVLVDVENGKLVIDGQQRLATITLILCAARDIMSEYNEHSKMEKILGLIHQTVLDVRKGPKLELNDTDRKAFRKIQDYVNTEIPLWTILSGKEYKTKHKTKSENLLRRNYLSIYDKLLLGLEKGFDPVTMMSDEKVSREPSDEVKNIRKRNIPEMNTFLTYMLTFNFVVKVNVGDDSTAFQIFETLNERGQTLAKSNLIKNHIFSVMTKHQCEKNELTTLSNEWNMIFDNTIGEDQRDDDFLMESLRSRTFESKYKITAKNLYKIIKELLTNDKICQKYIEDLKEDADFIKELNNPATYENSNTRGDIYALKSIKGKLVRIPIIAAKRQWGYTKDYEKLVELLVKFFFKFKVVGGQHPGKVEKLINELTKKITDGEKFAEIEGIILAIDDQDFQHNFIKRFAPNPDKDAAKYVLQCITMHLGTKYDDVKPISDLTLEHILPQKHDNGSWDIHKFFDHGGSKAEMENFVTRLGNMTLLHQAINKTLQNKSFIDKLDAKDENGNYIGYRASSLEINERLFAYEEWTANRIEEREIWFAERAEDIWKLDTYR